jgi:polysaccharide export outer membrane protein
MAGALSGCQSTQTTQLTDEDRQPYTRVGVQAGDIVRIVFPGAPDMNTAQQVQSDGTIALPLGGGLTVQGKNPPDIEAELLRIYGDQLVTPKVMVSVESAGFPVFVWGAVLRPGRVQCRESITLMEAIAEAGGALPGRSDLRRVKVVRQRDDGTTRTYILNLSEALKGEEAQQFYMRPSDVVYVPERFSFY